MPSFALPEIERIARSDGSVLLRSRRPLTPVPGTVIDWMRDWAERAPAHIFLGERDAQGAWRHWSYGEAYRDVCAVAAVLVREQVSGPLAIVARNSIDHAALMFGAFAAGVPVASVSAQYLGGPPERLRGLLSLIQPSHVYVDAPALAVQALGRDKVRPMGFVRELAAGPIDSAVPCRPDPGRIAKILLTSGSTGAPKAIVHTHAMMTTNNQMALDVWPFLKEAPAVFVDWLPWSHCFGSNNNLHLALRLGGTLFIDAGSPRPEGMPTTLRNLREIAPSMYFNVPAGFAALLPFLEEDAAFRRHFYSRMAAAFFAGAAMGPEVWHRFRDLSAEVRGRPVPLLTGWGATETGPAATFVHQETEGPANIGTPAPGVSLKLAPVEHKLELRVKSPSVTPGRFPGLATEGLFDDEGYYRTGDAGRLADPDQPDRGLVFDGRIAEDFKLSTGSWVSVGPLRVAVVRAAAPMLADVVVCAPDRDAVGILAWLAPLEAKASRATGDWRHRLRAAIDRHNRDARAGSTFVRRLLVLSTPPSAEAGEVNEKGYVNQRAARAQRSAEIERLYRNPPCEDVMMFESPC